MTTNGGVNRIRSHCSIKDRSLTDGANADARFANDPLRENGSSPRAHATCPLPPTLR